MKTTIKSPFLLILAITLIPLDKAFAYLDPGTGSYVVQIVIGAALGAGYVVKAYGRSILNFFSGLRNKNKGDEKVAKKNDPKKNR